METEQRPDKLLKLLKTALKNRRLRGHKKKFPSI